jgi:succinate dehydrogenase (ubiquinone) cytochrome b560 subunit
VLGLMLVNNFRILAKNRLFRPRSENRCHIINDIRTLSSKSYTERQIETGRPVSPHVTIYAFPVTALSSITNRVTGGALAVGTGGIGTLALLGVDVAGLASSIGSSAVGPVAKLAVAFPLIYHYIGGMRHLVWDRSPEMLTNDQVEKSSYMVIGGSAILSVIVACM